MFLLPGISSLPSRERGLKSTDSEVAAIMAASLPSRERGLKLLNTIGYYMHYDVAPFAGAWIEISHNPSYKRKEQGRSLRGSVD